MATKKPPRIHAGPRTWALVREAYLSGEEAKSVCARFGVKVDALRAQANRHGWTKRAYADSLIDPSHAMPRAGAPPLSGAADAAEPEAAASADPAVLAHAALAQAAAALRQGRAADAAAALKLAEGLSRLVAALPPPPAPALSPEEAARVDQEAFEAYRQDVWTAAQRLCRSMMTDGVGLPLAHTRAVFAWRAKHLGEAVAAQDRAQAERGGWSARVYDAEGRILPP